MLWYEIELTLCKMVSSFYINLLIKIVYYVIAERKLASQEIFFLRGWGGGGVWGVSGPGVKTQDLADKPKRKTPPGGTELLTWWLGWHGVLVTFSYPSSRQAYRKEREREKKGVLGNGRLDNRLNVAIWRERIPFKDAHLRITPPNWAQLYKSIV